MAIRLLFAYNCPQATTANLGGFMLTVTSHIVADTVILGCRGRLVRGEESSLLCAAVRHHGRDVVLDLAGVTAIDAAGIGALVSLQAAGIYLKLANPTEPVRTVLRLTGLDRVFEIVPPFSGEFREHSKSAQVIPAAVGCV
jgi:anti-anti-sigma factor